MTCLPQRNITVNGNKDSISAFAEQFKLRKEKDSKPGPSEIDASTAGTAYTPSFFTSSP